MNSKTTTETNVGAKPQTEPLRSEIEYTAPSAAAVNAYQKNLERWINEQHEEYVLSTPSVADGIAEATSTIERWRESLR